MKLSVPVPPAERPVEQEHLLDWVNLEAVPLLKQLRTVLNAQLRERYEATTAGGGAYTRIWTSQALPSTGAWWVLADVVASTTSGAFQAAGYTIAGLFRSSSGAVVQVGATTVIGTAESAAAVDCRFGVDVANRVVYLEGRDDAASPMKFVAVVRLLESRP